MVADLEKGTIPLTDSTGGIDLNLTLETGQTYLWSRDDGKMYSGVPAGWYSTAIDGEVIRVRQTGTHIEWEATIDADPLIRNWLRLEDDLDAIFEAIPNDPIVDRAYRSFRGMRLVSDPPVPCLISFICSTQMRVNRIHTMMRRLAAEYGDHITVDGRTYHSMPKPERLAEATERELRDLAIGYRAPYIRETAELISTGELHPDDVRGTPYEEARNRLTTFSGVGPKVADCVLLFSLGYLEAVPLDTWMKTAISKYYPDCQKKTYAETSRAIRRRFGSTYAGYAQTYVFHLLRSGSTT